MMLGPVWRKLKYGGDGEEERTQNVGARELEAERVISSCMFVYTG